MIQDRQVRTLRQLLSGGMPLYQAAMKTAMDDKTARKYRDDGKQPSELAAAHTWRTREDPFTEVWCEVHEQLAVNSGLQSKTLFEWLQRKYPGRFQDGQLRTFQRGVKTWRATEGPAKEVFFRQVHQPGRLCASDFTHMTSLGVTVQGQPFEHMVYHFVLTYSNWEWATICFSESFESLSEGLQGALWELGGAPERHRTDRLSAAVNNLSNQKEFTARYQDLMEHYGLTMEKIQAGHANENGDVESLHRHFKEAVDQALMLRGSRDFGSRGEYATFLQGVLQQKNSGRQTRLTEEQESLRRLPLCRRESCKRLRVRVGSGSLIRVQNNTYSVNSRLVGERVDVRVFSEHLEVWYGQKQVVVLPRLRGRNKVHINYRHVIDSLVRKPGAFENYCYREELFPTTRFRMAYDALRDARRVNASRDYLEILDLAAKENESAVDEALRVLLDSHSVVTVDMVHTELLQSCAVPAATDISIPAVDLRCFDSLFTTQEVWDGCQQGCEGNVACPVTGTAFTNFS